MTSALPPDSPLQSHVGAKVEDTVTDPPGLRGITHLSLSVRDLERSAVFYREVLGLRVQVPPFERSGGYRETILVLPNGIGLCLQEHAANDGSIFSESRTGLDHVAFAVPERADLDRWAARLDALGVPYDWQPERGFGSMLVFRDPDHIQLELHTPARD